jgi:hypothetical protein
MLIWHWDRKIGMQERPSPAQACVCRAMHAYCTPGPDSHLLKVPLQLLYDALQLDLQHVVLLTVAVAHLQDSNSTYSYFSFDPAALAAHRL